MVKASKAQMSQALHEKNEPAQQKAPKEPTLHMVQRPTAQPHPADPVTVHHIPDYAKLMADPIGGPLVGRPDSTSYKTTVVRMVDVHTITANADSNAAGYFPPSGSGGSILTVTMTAGTSVTATWTSGNAPALLASVIADSTATRLLSYCVEWTPTMSAMAATGKINLYASPEPISVPGTDITTLFDEEGICVHAGTPAVLIGRQLYESTFQTSASANNQFFPYICYVMAGLPVGGVAGQMRVTRIYETVPKSNTVAKATASHTVCDPMACCMVNNLVHPDTHKAKGDSGYASIVKNSMSVLKAAARAYGMPGSGPMQALARIINGASTSM